MKRLHLHLHVTDLAASQRFYESLFGSAPTRRENDYAKWMLEDPPLNFAISTRGQGHTGIDHVGIQVDNEAELAALKARGLAAGAAIADEGRTDCCYARSDKHWVVDPQGLAWEHFHTLQDIEVFGTRPQTTTDDAVPAKATGCCAGRNQAPVSAPAHAAGCC